MMSASQDLRGGKVKNCVPGKLSQSVQTNHKTTFNIGTELVLSKNLRWSWVNNPGSISDKVKRSCSRKDKLKDINSTFYLHDEQNLQSWSAVKGFKSSYLVKDKTKDFKSEFKNVQDLSCSSQM